MVIKEVLKLPLPLLSEICLHHISAGRLTDNHPMKLHCTTNVLMPHTMLCKRVPHEQS